MEDVVLHYQPGSAAQLSSLLERTEKVLERFPCRVPPVFTPWFPSAADRWLPIRPSRPAPVITSEAQTHWDSSVSGRPLDLTSGSVQGRPETARLSPETQEKDKDGLTERRRNLPPASICVRPEPDERAEITKLSPEKQPQKHKDGLLVTDREVKRSWSVFAQKGVLVQSSQSLSKQFHKMVWNHRLHLRQRAKWVICQQNCGASGDIEQAWRSVSRAIRSSRLPTCNANIQRDEAEIWVFCDLLHSELVGRFLKEELRLSGNISLSVHKLGNVFSL